MKAGPFAPLATLCWSAWQTAVASQTTIVLRLWSMALPAERESAWGQAELARMVMEKQTAFIHATFAMQRVMLRKPFSTDAVPVLSAGLRPYRAKTRANAKRLTSRL
jgi:hypothetical protein